jgi:alpha-mannosidase
MLTPHGFYEDQLPRITSAVHRLAMQIWNVQSTQLEVHATEPTEQTLTYEQGSRRPLARIESIPHHWGMMFDQRWCSIKLPQPSQEGDWIEVRGQGETTLYSNGIPFGGTDLSRKHVRLPVGTTECWAECIAENVGIWTPQGEDIDPSGCRYEGIYLATRDDAAWRAHTDLSVLHELIQIERRSVEGPNDAHKVPWGPRDQLNRATPRLKFLIQRLSRAVDAYEANGPAAMLIELDATREALKGGDPLFECVLTGHAHIDLVWRWPRRTGEFKAVHTFANALGLLDHDPEMVFGYSQPASYEAVQRRSPATMDRVRTKMAQGRWEANGITYVESDTQLSCGEALARSFILGQQAFEQLTGKPSKVLWLPDAFGFSHVLPQLIAESGGIGFFTTKAHWSSTNRFPHSAFRWRGANGAEVLGFVPGTFDYNGEGTAARVYEGGIQQRQSAIFPKTLLPTGIGDGGGGPTEEMCRRATVLADLSGLPRTRWGRIDEFYEQLDLVRTQLPVWQGEIYLEYHRGVQTTGHDLKRLFRATEKALQAWEAAAVLTESGPIDESAWKRMVFAQFHDDIPGSSCGEVYAEHLPELEALIERAHTTITSLFAGTDTNGPAHAAAPALLNPLPMELVSFQDGELFRLPPLSAVTKASAKIEPTAKCLASTHSLASGRVRVQLNDNGLIEHLSIDGQTIRLVAPAGGVVAFADRPHAFEAWDIDRASLDYPLPAQREATIQVEESEGAQVVVAVRSHIARRGSLVTRYSLIAGEPVLRIEYEIELDEIDTLLKATFPTGYCGQSVRYGAPFGSVLRGQQPGRRADEAAFEVPASRWASICDDGESNGMALMAESKYGFGAQSGLLHISLVRTALVTPWGLQNKLRRPDAGPTHFDLGKTVVRLAVGCASDQLSRTQQPAVLTETLFTDPVQCQCAGAASPFRGLRGDEHVVPAWAKPAGMIQGQASNGDWILRLHEVLGRPGRVELELESDWAAQRVDLLEHPLSESDPQLVVDVAPCSFASVRIHKV